MRRLRIGTRGSQLALWQARHVEALLAANGHAAEIVTITTSGDRIASGMLAAWGGKGLFTKEIEDALRAGAIDLAVHSLKDVAAELAKGLTLAAYLAREDARDALAVGPEAQGRSLDQLAAGARVGTSSLRRRAQLAALRPDLRPVELRGNVDTRLRKLAAGECDALLLAAAGLVRLQREEAIAELLEPERMCPAAGQGIVAVECRDDADATRAAAAELNDAASARAGEAERSVLRALGAGCRTPIGVHAVVEGTGLRVMAVVSEPRGGRHLRAHGTSAEAVARDLADQGARELLALLAAEPLPLPEAP